MTTGVILGSNEQPVDHSESLVFSPNRIQDTNIGDVQVEQKMKHSDISRNDLSGRPNIEL